MISLDGNSYTVYSTEYTPAQDSPSTTRRNIDGDVDRTESGIIDRLYIMTLRVTVSQLTTLKTTYAKRNPTGTPAGNLLDFTDEQGVRWNPSSPGGNVNTGVYFEGELRERPVTPNGYQTKNFFLVPIQLRVNAKT